MRLTVSIEVPDAAFAGWTEPYRALVQHQAERALVAAVGHLCTGGTTARADWVADTPAVASAASPGKE
jgi:hypothetical protein